LLLLLGSFLLGHSTSSLKQVSAMCFLALHLAAPPPPRAQSRLASPRAERPLLMRQRRATFVVATPHGTQPTLNPVCIDNRESHNARCTPAQGSCCMRTCIAICPPSSGSTGSKLSSGQ